MPCINDYQEQANLPLYQCKEGSCPAFKECVEGWNDLFNTIEECKNLAHEYDIQVIAPWDKQVK